ncbi:MAG: electron transfer flavoprotein subunit alpha/FixB family protein [Flavobacteriaceae bacterium]
MSVLVYIESENGLFKKSALEVASYGKAVANSLQTSLCALVFNVKDASILGTYGVSKVLSVETTQPFTAEAYSKAIKQAVERQQASVLILSNSANSKYLAPMLSSNLNAGYVPNVVEVPKTTSPFIVKRSVFSNKAFCSTEITTDIKIIGLSNNAYGVKEQPVEVDVEAFTPDDMTSKISIDGVEKNTDKISIADADIVVSAGRGLKGPENWGMIEELADVLGAATACSKPVSDLGWRPHSEHVGQTGKPVATNLYIAIGISGAIQHLAGVNSSKTKVVINTDPEAPFFKAADYGIVGDAFEVVPELIKKLQAFKAQNT